MKVAQISDYARSASLRMLREPGGFLRHPFIVPGAGYSQQLWDWDSFWTCRGLLKLPDLDESTSKIIFRHAVGSWKNFFENQYPNGTVPIMLESIRGDVFRCGIEDSTPRNQAKPVLGQFALDIATAMGDFSWIEPYFDSLLKFYRRWFSAYGTSCGLIVWASDAAIGLDNDPTTYGRPAYSSANLLLNCLLHADLQAASKIAESLGKAGKAAELRSQAELLAAAIDRECWDPVDEFYYSVDVQCKDQRCLYLPGIEQGMAMTWQTVPIKFKLFTGFLPLAFGIATPDQAEIVIRRHWLADDNFRATSGVRTLAKNERLYDLELNSSNPSNWMGPTWILANYLVHQALRRCGFSSAAEDLRQRTFHLLEEDLRRTGTLHECYHPDSGQPNFNADFVSWNILALTMPATTEPV